ncbi:ashwin isoform X1 [Denticeps clupeoides]|nr:ashwin isoform X1 [Denticeps clupeoides]
MGYRLSSPVKMASNRHGGDGGNGSRNRVSDHADLLLHPELLSRDFLQLVLNERKITVVGEGNRERLTGLYLQHVIPLPQRDLPNSRWGKRVEKTRGRQRTASTHCHSDGGRKWPLIVYDGNSSPSVKLKHLDPGTKDPHLATDRVKPPPTINVANPIRKLSSSNGSSTSSPYSMQSHIIAQGCYSKTSSGNSKPGSPMSPLTATPRLKRLTPSGNEMEIRSPEVKKKIQHVTWP